jgi:ataxin-10
MIAKMVGDEQLTKDDIPVFLRHAELIASSFVDQCRTVLKLTSEQHTEDEVRRQNSQFWLERAGTFSNSV